MHPGHPRSLLPFPPQQNPLQINRFPVLPYLLPLRVSPLRSVSRYICVALVGCAVGVQMFDQSFVVYGKFNVPNFSDVF